MNLPPLEPIQHKPAMQPTMRRSCHFCRSRKIRCSGQSICSACRERNIDCVYGREGSKGRPRGSTSKNSARTASHKAANSGSASPSQKQLPTPVSTTNPNFGDFQSMSQEIPQNIDTKAQQRQRTSQTDHSSDSKHTVAAELQQVFGRLFNLRASGTHDPYPNAVRAFSRKNSLIQASLAPFETASHPTMTYEAPMFMLVEGFVEMVVLRFGDLGCNQLSGEPSGLFRQYLDADDTKDMFDDPYQTPKPNPMLDYTEYQTLQTLDIWFSHHPLAFILSKTLLLRSYRDGTQNNVLLAVLFADVKSAQQEAESRTKGTEIYNWAQSQLFSMSNANSDLSTVQALTLLGWCELCAGRARRSISYFLHASSLIASFQPPTVQLNQINGKDVGEVEAELARSIRWLTFAILLWAFMQLDTPMMELFPSQSDASFPPIDESCSTVYALDVVSDNISTLTHQARTIRDFWPISHVASTTAHIYALYPREQISSEPPGPSSWQSSTLNQLRHLSTDTQSTSQDVSVVCAKVRHVLAGALELLESQSEHHVSRGLLLSAYHTMVVHFLFPRSRNGHANVPVTESLIDNFCCSARSALRVHPALESGQEGGRMNIGLCSDSIAEVFMVGVDTCARVFTYIQNRALLHLEPETRIIAERREELTRLASDLRKLSQHEKLSTTKRAKVVKKQLKNVIKVFEAQGHNAATLFDFSPFGPNDSISMNHNSPFRMSPDFTPGTTDSPTIGSGSSTLSHSESTSIWPQHAGIYEPSTVGGFSGGDLTFAEDHLQTPFWGTADVLNLQGGDQMLTGDFGISDDASMRKPKFDGTMEDLQIYHGNSNRGAVFDDSAFRPR